MKFKWNMTEAEWKRMIDEHINRIDNSENCYGSVYVGKLCIEFIHTKDESDWDLYTNVYEIGKDTGYGYTNKNNIPYDLTDAGLTVPIRCKTFESFKEKVEEKIKKMVEEYNLVEQAEVELVNWD